MRISDWSSDVCSSDLNLPNFVLPMRPADAIFTLVIIALLNLKIPLSKLGKELRRTIMSNNVKVIVPEVVVGIGRMDDGGIHHAYGLLTSVLAISGFETTKVRSEEHTSELQSLMRISYAVYCLKKTRQFLLMIMKILRKCS